MSLQRAFVRRRTGFSLCDLRIRRPAFTLVELLVVITIIGILAAFLVPAVFGAVRRARVAAIAMELTQLAQAIETYRTKKGGDYPPDFSNAAAVTAHMLKAYPRSSFNVENWMKLTNTTPVPATLDPAEALVFWLSVAKDDTRNPIAGTGKSVSFFDFDPTRLVDLDGDGWQEYLPKYAKDGPYVYFDGRAQATSSGVNTSAYFYAVYPPAWSAHPYSSSTGTRPAALVRAGAPPAPANALFGVVRPMRSNSNVANAATDPTFPVTPLNPTSWINPGKFQIICAGMDGLFGTDDVDSASGQVSFKQFPVSNYYNSGSADVVPDQDNLANFSDGRTFEDSKP